MGQSTQRANPVYGAWHQQLTSREHNKLSPTQARDPVVAIHGTRQKPATLAPHRQPLLPKLTAGASPRRLTQVDSRCAMLRELL
jgi:hypothetical protein